ncbi:myosin, partial [Thraustotheca clavata]
ETKDAMDTIGIDEREQHGIFEIISAILHLGEVAFKKETVDKCTVATMDKVDAVAKLLNTASSVLKATLCQRKMTAGGETYTIPLNAIQAADLRDAFAKGIYSRLFDWLVGRINIAICSTKNVKSHIGLLDIFGFESFDHNGFEQLCINYTNEKLQQKFNSDIFKTVQTEYIEEGIPLDLVTFEDNQPILDLIEGKLGIVDLLNETCVQPKGTDSMFVNKIHEGFASHKSIDRVRLEPIQFKIIHYAGEVVYDGTNFLEKNKDTLPADLMELLASSQSSFIRDVFPELDAKTSSKSAPRRQGFLVGNTIAGSFRKQLTELMDQIAKTSTQYVRCIKPNANKSATEFDRHMVVDQLRCAGVIAAIRISRAAFPNRLSLKEFASRFAIICPTNLRTAPPEVMILSLLQRLLPRDSVNSSKNSLFAIGQTKVYFSSGLLQRLEDRRNELLREFAIRIQKHVRGYATKQRFRRSKAAIMKIQAQIRALLLGVKQRQNFLIMKAGVIQLQAHQRRRHQRKKFLKAIAIERERIRRLKVEADIQKTLDSPPVVWADHDEDDELIPESPRPTYDESLIANVKGQSNTELLKRIADAEALAIEAQEATESAIALNEKLQKENAMLREKLSQNVQAYANAELKEENDRLKYELAALQSKVARSEEVSLLSAKVIDSRITFREGRQFVEYKLQIETNTRGTLFVWHRYSTFRNLATTLQTKNGYRKKDIPDLPNKQLFGNFSEKIIQDRVSKLNEFLDAATKAEYLQWGIRVDQDTCVYKRRMKQPPPPSHNSHSPTQDPTRDTVSIATFRSSTSSSPDDKDHPQPRQSFVSRFTLKRNKTNGHI